MDCGSPGLGARLAARIALLGPITLADYMAAVLTDPDHGYYMTGDPFGARGDFITAPEISQMFGELIGLWCADTWQRMGRPNPVLLVELGPGRGTLMADALRALRLAPDFRNALDLHLVEISPALRARQRAALDETVSPTWHETLADVPHGPILLIANEFFDALPIRQLEKRPEGWCERLVTLAPNRSDLAFALGPPSPQAGLLIPPGLHDVPEGALVEVSPSAVLLAAEIGRRLTTHGGAALTIDYGHAQPRSGSTLQALRRHAAHDVLTDPGTADLTAHVDFSALAQSATESGARGHGPTPQGKFLKTLGIQARAETLAQSAVKSANPTQAGDIASALRRLTDATEMGELFKVLGLSHPSRDTLAGFP